MPTLADVFECESPVALVTGSGAPRVGRAIATHLASLGCRIALHAHTSRDQAEQAAKEIRRQHKVEVIVTIGAFDQEGTPAKLVAETDGHFGRIDILVNSAAIWSPLPLESICGDDLRRYFEVNAVASFMCAREAGLRMIDQPAGGSIINIGDWATVRPYLDHAAYFPSKGAIEAMTRSLAVELASRHRRIRVNCIQPGPVLFADDVSEEDRERVARSTLTGETGTPEHVAHAVQFLCENDFVTGVTLPVDGGRAIYAPDGLQVGMNTG